MEYPQTPAYSSYYVQRAPNYQYRYPTAYPNYPAKVETQKRIRLGYVIAFLMLIAGVAMLVFGVTSERNDKVSAELIKLTPTSPVMVVVLCNPCGDLQVNDAVSIVGPENYRAKIGDRFLLLADAGQIETLSKRSWVRYIQQPSSSSD